MAHKRKSELNRVLRDGENAELPYGLPSDDLHPDGERNAQIPPPGAPDRRVSPDAKVDWGVPPGEDPVRSSDTSANKEDEAA
jgi:hypothetical protein